MVAVGVGKPDVEPDPVHPPVHVIDPGQVPGRPPGVLGLPGLAQSRDGRGGQSSVGPQEALQRRGEVPGRQAPQIQHRQHLGHLRGPSHVGGEDPGREPVIGAWVMHPGNGHLHPPRPGRHLAGGQEPVPDHHPVTGAVDHTSVSVQIRPAFRQQRHRQHLLSGQTTHLIQIDPTPSGRISGHGIVLDYLEHRRTPPRRPHTGDSIHEHQEGTPRANREPVIHNFWV